jgi:hypothetical protein
MIPTALHATTDLDVFQFSFYNCNSRIAEGVFGGAAFVASFDINNNLCVDLNPQGV